MQRLALARAQQAARLALAGERPVEAAERLEADEIAQHEHVERDLQAQLALDLAGGVRVLAGLVVLHDPARAERILVDAVDLPGEREPVAEVEAALQLGRRALAAEEHLEAPRHERELRLALDADDRLEIAPQRRVELARLHLRHVHAHALQRLVEARAHQAHRVVDDALVEPLDAELLRQAREELVERVVRDGAAQLRVDLRVDRARAEEPLDEPRRRAVGEPLELGDVERRLRLELLEHERMRQPRRAVERLERALEPPLPRVRARERVGAVAVARCKLRERAQPLAIGGRVVERPRERRQRPPPRPEADVIRIERRPHFVPERARLARVAVVGRGLAHEIEPLERARAGGVEEVAVAADGIGPLEARAALVEEAPRVVVEERRRRAAPRQAPLLEAEHEDDVEPARAGAREVEHGDAAGLVAAERAQRVALERRRQRPRAESSPAIVRQRSSSVSSLEIVWYVRRSSRDVSPTGGWSSP